MPSPRPTVRCRALAAALIIAAIPAIEACSQPAMEGFEPQVGQPGKDVVWVPTPDALVDRMLRMANVGPGDRLVDLGSGDGRIAIAAARDYKIPATGIEYNPDMVALSRRNAARERVTERVRFLEADIFATDFSDATVVTMYLLPNLNLRLRPTLLAMKPGTRIVSHAFDMRDWQPEETAEVEGQTAYFWIVPAQVGGTWSMQLGGDTLEIKVDQQFQNFSGTAGPSGAPLQGTLRGDEIRMTLTDSRGTSRELVGKVAGEQMSGTAGSSPFTATRTAPPMSGS